MRSSYHRARVVGRENIVTEVISVTENCEFCGLPLPEGKARGRKLTKHPKCGQVARSLDYSINAVSEMSLSESAKKRIRRQMFYVANHFTQEAKPIRDRSGLFISWDSVLQTGRKHHAEEM